MNKPPLTPEALICILIHSALMRERTKLGLSEKQVKRVMGMISPIVKNRWPIR